MNLGRLENRSNADGRVRLDNDNGRLVGIAKLLMLGLILSSWKKISICSISFVLMKILSWLSGKQEKER
ncbi:MAG TPA: hypothetical protein VJJ52_05600 [Candidatus Nanoarchaeia archaeon]|nr:hypothetical protein [Candidatus Nanoarchaeia archaeon]